MKRFFALLAVALVLSPAARVDEGSEFWFNDGLAWYQHPCGFEAFVKYGKQDTPQIRHNY